MEEKMADKDLRREMLQGMPWYDSLEQPAGDEPSPWYQWKRMPADKHAEVVITVLHWLRDKGLWDDVYRNRLGSVQPGSLTTGAAKSKDESVSASLWEILAEPFAAMFLERGLHWDLLQREPTTERGKKGDWLFKPGSSTEVLVEVETTSEYVDFFQDEEDNGGEVDLEGQARRLQRVLDRAYAQLPRKGPATLIAVMEDWRIAIADLAVSEETSPVYTALYGPWVLRFNIGVTGERDLTTSDLRYEPMLREMWWHKAKHRHAGAVLHLNYQVSAGIEVLARVYPNPWAEDHARIPVSDFGGLCWVEVERDAQCFRQRVHGNPAAVSWASLHGDMSRQKGGEG
jgi:hypothetical protein